MKFEISEYINNEYINSESLTEICNFLNKLSAGRFNMSPPSFIVGYNCNYGNTYFWDQDNDIVIACSDFNSDIYYVYTDSEGEEQELNVNEYNSYYDKRLKNLPLSKMAGYGG